ncbi:uncharacterized protein PITG_08396 [Phytophthora infestans T30-4]|uniref:t-SNARE coiled-coil homology domain-containing protein n=1 Tax=Phytophthora infestans (strain T30-4) TaxID=403677 RepID=D0NAH8_PHYIT|nr:uncharacterized protein PITG_08396 [Phytophthora infestans T30-4]EEY54836.1 conserved hypothetical protein [Phytophthora infestans T30-4]|eukprot:XP_002903781.1 conserved hypothetical protein [Phytophthora infestans T30-4]
MATQRQAVPQHEWEQRHTQALRDTAESLQLGRATAHTLSMQAEQLGRSEGMVDETQATVDMSKRVLRGMTWSGWFYNKLSTTPQLSNSKEIAMGFICPECKVKFQSAEQLGTHYGNSYEDVHDKFLRDLVPQLTELKQQSLALGSALDTQNEQLGRLDSKIGRVHHDMKKVGIQANKIMGKKAPVVFRFRCAFQEAQSRRFLRDVDGEALLSADVVVDGCTFRAYTLGDDSDVWGFQSEKSSNFLGVNRYGNLKVQGADFNSYEHFLVESKASTPLFCLSSYFGLGGWVTSKEPLSDSKLSIIRGTPENKPAAARFRVVNLEDGIHDAPR